MKKFKIILIGTCIMGALVGAFATNRCRTCEFYPQYRLINNNYVPAGEDGIDYICWDVSGICTYWKPGLTSPYLPCKNGAYLSLH